MITDLESFRTQLVEFLEHELPRQVGELPPATADYWGGRTPELPHPSSQRYCAVMAERGLTAPSWPVEYGGGGLDKEQAKVVQAELRRLRLPTPLIGFDIAPNGTGDAVAALFSAHWIESGDVALALGKAASSIFAVLEATQARGERELQLVAAQDQLVAPPRHFTAEKL